MNNEMNAFVLYLSPTNQVPEALLVTAPRRGLTLKGAPDVTKHTPSQPINPNGLCQCGCGKPAPIAKANDRRLGYVKGQPKRFRQGHHLWPRIGREGPNPSGICMCGCGQPAPIAQGSDFKWGHVKGKAMRFIAGHQFRRGTPAERFWERVGSRSENQCWIWGGSIDRGGYGRLAMGRSSVLAHRFSYELHHGPIPDGMDVCHSCDNPACVNPAHLWLGDAAANRADMVAKGRQGDWSGERSGVNKLTEHNVRKIRELLAQGMRHATISKRFGVCRSTISLIHQGKTWRCVSENDGENLTALKRRWGNETGEL